METSQKNSSGNNQTLTMVLVLLLVGASFFIGTLWNKVQKYEKTGVAPGGAPSEPVQKDVVAFAKTIGLDEKAFKACLTDKDIKANVQAQLDSGSKAGVQGTPGNFVVNTKTGKVSYFPGALPQPTMKAKIDAALNETEDPKDLIDLTKVTLDPVSDQDRIKGNKDATVVVIEYSDLQCPYCQSFHKTMTSLIAQYDQNQVAWVFRHFPLSFHKFARAYAEATECAYKLGGNDKFWELADKIFTD